MNLSALAILLIESRQNLSLTQSEIAESIGVAQSTYNNWESGKHPPKIKYIVKLCELLQLKIEDLTSLLS